MCVELRRDSRLPRMGVSYSQTYILLLLQSGNVHWLGLVVLPCNPHTRHTSLPH